MEKRKINWIRTIARTIVILWAGFWTFFGIASGLGEGLPSLGVLMHTLFPGLIFVFSLVVPLVWERPGAILLILEGLFVCIAYPIMAHGRFPVSTVFLVLLTMALPPLASGMLFLSLKRKPEEKV